MNGHRKHSSLPDSAAPFTSVIIPTCMRGALVERAVRSVLASGYPADRFEVIVVDAGSDDDTAARITRLQADFPGRIRFFTVEPRGPSASRNFGAEQARGELLAFTDSDCEVHPNWLASGALLFRSRPALGIVQGRTRPPEGVTLRPRSRYVWVEEGNWIYDTCNVFYRREAFLSAGGFSREYFLNMRPARPGLLVRLAPWMSHVAYVLRASGEDCDLGWRVRKNWEYAFSPEALVFHEVRILSPLHWLISEGAYAFGIPRIVRKYPAVRSFLVHGYFLTESHVSFPLVPLAAVLALFVHPLALLLAIPYMLSRSREETRFWRGPLKLVRGFLHLPRDLVTVAMLLASSIRERTLVL